LDTGNEKIWKIISAIPDPEIPVLNLSDLGIIRDIRLQENEVEVIITPTYSGCPAMDMIASDIKAMLFKNGYNNIKITSVLSPAWTTEWMSDEGKQKLAAYGIAPPERLSAVKTAIECPQCHSTNTKVLSEFGSTACKALYQCNDCKEPFDYFKCH
jgi:ring-1,2-phenylacetyl-CoA epoxidase subunit PaaD